MKKCRNCHYWRDKAWDGDEGVGVCDNPETIRQVSILNIEIIKNLVSGETEKDKISNSIFIKNSLRFNSEFGCLNFLEKN